MGLAIPDERRRYSPPPYENRGKVRTNYKKTRLILNEATHIVVYPLSTSYHALKHLLKNYCGVDEDKIKELKKCGSRWLCFRKHYPQVAITQHSVEILNS